MHYNITDDMLSMSGMAYLHMESKSESRYMDIRWDQNVKNMLPSLNQGVDAPPFIF